MINHQHVYVINDLSFLCLDFYWVFFCVCYGVSHCVWHFDPLSPSKWIVLVNGALPSQVALTVAINRFLFLTDIKATLLLILSHSPMSLVVILFFLSSVLLFFIYNIFMGSRNRHKNIPKKFSIQRIMGCLLNT